MVKKKPQISLESETPDMAFHQSRKQSAILVLIALKTLVKDGMKADSLAKSSAQCPIFNGEEKQIFNMDLCDLQ